MLKLKVDFRMMLVDIQISNSWMHTGACVWSTGHLRLYVALMCFDYITNFAFLSECVRACVSERVRSHVRF